MARRKKKRSWGRGSIQERGQGRTIRWREKVIAPDGSLKTVHRSKQLGSVTVKEATETWNEHRAGSIQPKPQPVTFSEFVATWKVNVLPMYSKHSTRKHHGYIVEKKLVPYFGNLFLNQITGEHVQQFIRELVAQGCAPHSIHHYHTVLSTILSTAKKWKRISENPASGVSLPVLKPVRPQPVLNYEQAQALLTRLQGRAHVAVALALLSGMRRGELFAVRWRSFDPDAGTLDVSEAIYDRVLGDPKTADSRRKIPLPSELIQLLIVWRSKTRYKGPEDFILAGRKGIAGDHARILRDHVKPACVVLELPVATWMTFRRTWATWADEGGVSAKMRGAMMGNSAEINERIYTKVIPDSLRVAAQRVGSQLYADCTQSSNWLN